MIGSLCYTEVSINASTKSSLLKIYLIPTEADPLLTISFRNSGPLRKTRLYASMAAKASLTNKIC